MNRMSNMKWQLMLYFAAASALIVAICTAGWMYGAEELPLMKRWLGFAAVVLFVGLAVGYLAAKHFQRKVDALHLAIIQLSKGNLSNRIPLSDNDPFRWIYRDFNAMAQSIEERVRLLQKLGEENVMLKAQANEDAVIEERKRLARDLHDTVSQQLFAIHMAASSLPKVADRDPALAGRLMEQLIQMSHHAQKQMRGLIAQLRPIELEGKSLKSALDQWFPDYCRQNGLQGTLDLSIGGTLPEAIERQMFLLIQEGMANVVKHSGADRVALSLHDRGHQYLLQIQDNGAGFDPHATKAGSYGLTTMKERAQKLGGDFEIFSRPGFGTRISIRIPKFKREDARADVRGRAEDATEARGRAEDATQAHGRAEDAAEAHAQRRTDGQTGAGGKPDGQTGANGRPLGE